MKKIAIAVFGIIMLSSCGSSKSLYSWYHYEDSSYKYEKKQTPESKVKLMEDYQKMMAKQGGVRKSVPPGMFAENGYQLILDGKKEEGLIYLKKEVALYPESATFIERIIKQLEKQ